MPMDAINAFIESGDSIFNHRLTELVKSRPVVSVNEAVSKSSSSKSGGKKGKIVTVRNGDTLGAIAKRNGTTVNKIKKLNGMKGNMIRAGQKLRVR
jgi:membrane-bound lytic murein transglycosylase D